MLCFTKFLVVKTFMEKKMEGEYGKFPSKTFCHKLSKNFVEESFSLSLVSGIKKIYAS